MSFSQTPFYQRFGALFTFSKSRTFEIQDEYNDYPTKYIPVQWKGYSQSLRKYQGEILYKERILKKYFNLLDDIKRRPGQKELHDWTGMIKILEMIFNAF
jgi:hypothetical protein